MFDWLQETNDFRNQHHDRFRFKLSSDLITSLLSRSHSYTLSERHPMSVQLFNLIFINLNLSFVFFRMATIRNKFHRHVISSISRISPNSLLSVVFLLLLTFLYSLSIDDDSFCNLNSLFLYWDFGSILF